VGRYSFVSERFTSASASIPVTPLVDHMFAILQLRIFHVAEIAREVLAEYETRCECCFRSTLNLSDITSTALENKFNTKFSGPNKTAV
jgi:hypothetical protein